MLNGPKSERVVVGPQAGPQSGLLSCPCDEIFYGGQRGGGKSYGLALDFFKHQSVNGRHAKGIMFRRTMPEFEDMVATMQEIFPLFGAEFKVQKNTWVFPNKATLKLRYLERDDHAMRYQGHNYTWIAVDEVGNFPVPGPIDLLRGCLRSAKVKQKRFIMTGNPGGPGHNWLKKRYVDPIAPGKVQHMIIKAQKKEIPWTRVFIPSSLEDNKLLLDNDPNYEANLWLAANGKKWLYDAWRNGNWDIVAGGVIDDLWDREIHTLPPFEIPSGWYIDRTFDWGSTHPFSVGWWAEADGTEAKMGDGTIICPPKGTLFRVAEWYGSSGEPNTGLRLGAKEIAAGIIEREKFLYAFIFKNHKKVNAGPADNQIRNVSEKDTDTIEKKMKSAPNYVKWTESDKSPGSRINGLEIFRGKLQASLADFPEDPGFYVFDTCVDFISLVPIMPRDKKKPDDVDTTCEDHIWDETRYRCLTGRKRKSKKSGF